MSPLFISKRIWTISNCKAPSLVDSVLLLKWDYRSVHQVQFPEPVSALVRSSLHISSDSQLSWRLDMQGPQLMVILIYLEATSCNLQKLTTVILHQFCGVILGLCKSYLAEHSCCAFYLFLSSTVQVTLGCQTSRLIIRCCLGLVFACWILAGSCLDSLFGLNYKTN